MYNGRVKFAEAIRKFFEGFGIEFALILIPLGGAVIFGVLWFSPLTLATVLTFAVALSPIWLPLVLFLMFFERWRWFVKKEYQLKQGNVTLEILLPEEIFKSPLAMELALGHFWQTASPDNLVQTYWDGKHPPTFGLELVSDGGRIRFFINAPTVKFKNIIEAQLYSQYPGIEIRTLPVDYAAEIDHEMEEFDVFAMHFGKKKESELPIKTYIDYELHENPKEEEKIDPITQMLETLANVGPNERIWVQILISAHREETFKTGSLHTVPDWKDRIKKKINEIALRDDKRTAPIELEGMPRLTDKEREVVSSMERSLSKIPFKTAIRVIYAAKKGFYLPGERIGAIITSWFQYNDNTMNQFGLRWRSDYDWNWWQDPTGRKRHHMKKEELEYYKRRYYEHKNQSDHEFIMSVEELATIFHLPGKVAITPAIGRIPSSRAEAPPNLPTGIP